MSEQTFKKSKRQPSLVKSAQSDSTLPNLFILGAPKCGTTSLAEWLNEHPDIFISNPKEPKFFNTDWQLPNRPQTLKDYEYLFEGADNYIVLGEATTGYLASKVAVSKILNYSPAAKFVVCLREPIEMLISLHAQRLKEGTETERSLAVAWGKQGERSEGRQVPISCTDFQTLLYGSICSLGEQVGRLFDLVEKDRVCFVLLEDITLNPGGEYRRILTFLGVEDDGKTIFPIRNKGSLPRSLILSQVSRVLGRFKKQLGIHQNLGIQHWIRSCNEFPRKKKSVEPTLRAELIAYFSNDVKKLGSLINRDLSHWLSDE